MGLSSPLRTTPVESRLTPGFLSIPMGNGETLVLHNVIYCPSFTDNVLSAVHLTTTANWNPTFHGLISSGGRSYLLSAFNPDTDSIGLEYDQRQQRRVLCLNVSVTNGVAAGPVLDRLHGRPGSSNADLAVLPILPHKLPACTIHAAARADLRLSDVIRYLDRHTWANIANKAILSTWIEQPPASGSRDVTNDTLHLAVRPEPPYLDDEDRTFSLERPPLRPRLNVLNLRKEMRIGPESTAQRANMTDTVPHIVYAEDISKIAVRLGQDAASTEA